MKLTQDQQLKIDQVITDITREFIKSQGDSDPENSRFNQDLTDVVHKASIRTLFNDLHNNQSKTAIYLGVNRASLRSWAKRADLI